VSPSEKTSPGRVYDVVADALAAAQVEHIFGVLGEDTAPLVVAAVARGIAYHAARHENQAVAMADGYARASGRMGVATVTGGPGFTNALTAINTAHRAGSPVAVLVGAGRPQEDDHAPEVAPLANGASWLKHFPQAAVLSQLGIPVVKPLTADAAERDAQRALAAARHGTVALVLGRALLLAPAAGHAEAAADAEPLSMRRAVFAAPDAQQIGELADFLQETWAVRRPVILAGHGAAVSGAGPVLQRLAERIGAVLATTLRARGLFHGDPFAIGVCGTYASPEATELVTQADCVLAFGATLNPWTTYGNSLFPKALLVQVDSDETSIGRFLPTALAIHGDAGQVAEALLAELERRGHAFEGGRNAEVRASIAAHRKDAEFRDRSTATHVDPRALMLALDRLLPPNRILCVDAGQQARFAIRCIETTQPRNFIQALDAGALGLAIGIGIGAAMGRPRDLVVVAVGDGGLMMQLGDLESTVRLRLPMLVVVSNDESFGAEVNVLANLGLDSTLANTPCPSFEAMALAMGARAATVRSVADLAVIEPWLRERPGVPLVLDCRIDPAVRTE
jgi:acetolactate synthase-1/2/3 large subunit